MRLLRPFGRSDEECAQEGTDEEKTYQPLDKFK